MIVETPKTKAAEAAESWKRQYWSPKGGWSKTFSGPANVEYEALIALGPTPEPGQVDKAIGNKSWTRTECGECGAENVPVVVLGEEPDYESSTAWVCLGCLRKAVAMLEEG